MKWHTIHISTYASGRLAIASIYSEGGLCNRTLNSGELKPVDVLLARRCGKVTRLVRHDKGSRVTMQQTVAEVKDRAETITSERVHDEVMLSEDGVPRAESLLDIEDADTLRRVPDLIGCCLDVLKERVVERDAGDVKELSKCPDGAGNTKVNDIRILFRTGETYV